MDHVVLEIDLHLINNIRVIYYVVSNSVEQRVLTNKINGILAKKDVHRFNNGEGSYYSIPVEKIIYTTVKVREDLDTKKHMNLFYNLLIDSRWRKKMNPYEQLIQDLIDGKIEKIDVKKRRINGFSRSVAEVGES